MKEHINRAIGELSIKKTKMDDIENYIIEHSEKFESDLIHHIYVSEFHVTISMILMTQGEGADVAKLWPNQEWVREHNNEEFLSWETKINPNVTLCIVYAEKNPARGTTISSVKFT